MEQSTVTTGVILLAFVVFITMKGNLRKYMQVVGLV